MRADLADWIALNMIRGIGPRTANQLLEEFGAPAQIFAASPKLGAKSFSEFVTIAKAKPGSIRYATAGPATSSRLSVELFKAISKLDGATIFFKGGGPALNDLLGGHVQRIIMDFPAIQAQMKAGKLRGIALAAEKRIAQMPDLPTSIEAGLPDLQAVNWFVIDRKSVV